MTEHTMAHRLAENAPTENPLEALDDALSFSSDDWSASRSMAWVWAIVCGWEEATSEVAARYGWDETVVARLGRLHAEFRRLAGEEADR